VEGDLGMLKRFWSIALVTFAVLLSSSTLVNAAPRSQIDPGIHQTSLEFRAHRSARLPGLPVSPAGTSEPGDDDAPNRDGNWNDSPVVDDTKGTDQIRLWSFKNLGTGIRLHLLKWFSALR
jgi:hypothetical protein